MDPKTFDNISAAGGRADGVACAAWHALFWLVFANCVGVGIAVLLLFPMLNLQLGEWTYGRWIMVHMNLELYGWTTLPLVGFLFRVYGADRAPAAVWCRPVVWMWSAVLCVGVVSWLFGNSSGKMFLDWSGYARIFFIGALLVLWLLLLFSLLAGWRQGRVKGVTALGVRLPGLGILLAVPLAMYYASTPGVYPPFNPDTGGPTGASQLESSLAVVMLLLLLPFAIADRKPEHTRIVSISWMVLAMEAVLCAAMGRGSISHHVPSQYLSLSSILVWLPLTPLYYAAFGWHGNTRRWRLAFLWWWSALLITGWVFFLPGVLDHFKFTDGLVGHSFVAMAGFASSLMIFVIVQLLGESGRIFSRPRAFFLWHGSVIAYVVLMTVAGWREGGDPAFTIVPGLARNSLYTLRLVSGIAMLLASLDWLLDATALRGERASFSDSWAMEKTA